ncbi:hypothetical protein [Candidatus Uabimicrobium amorphum]|uniref:Lipoprotein n=1 Tax=Uabimicrobium amorphum TaxID=2596890 RepID=A0A5S9ITJ2_UABAM|nr:hypothetical protein [Candidatus Uabimicrobium amorphum]BBM86365.1 hypothetical protein UABAM_04751 [Candidatus Uabimicrobium amorphum]
MNRKSFIFISIFSSIFLISCRYIEEQKQIKEFATYYAGHPLPSQIEKGAKE